MRQANDKPSDPTEPRKGWASDDDTVERRDRERGAADVSKDPPARPAGVERESADVPDEGVTTANRGVGNATTTGKEVE